MGRELKRVPLDFNWGIGKLWYGYLITTCVDINDEGICDDCKRFAEIKGMAMTNYGCPNYAPVVDLPTGEGYQLWENTSKGSPQSPVFFTLDELCKWCAENATTFGNSKATAGKWKQMFERGFVCHEEENVVFF